MLFKRTGDAAFTLGIIAFTLLFLFRWGSSGLSLAVWLILLPLYLFRIIVWSNWEFWKSCIYFHATPRIWMSFVFILWTFVAFLLFQLKGIFSITVFNFHPLLSVSGFLLSLAGLFLTIWTLWLLGIERAVLTTLIFGEREPAQKKIIKHGPYAVTPHPMFLGETMIIIGTFFFSGEASLIILFLFSMTANLLAARGEESDLMLRAGKEYKDYLKKRKFLLWSRKK